MLNFQIHETEVNPKDATHWRSSQECYAPPALAKKLVANIDRYDAFQVIEPIWITKNETTAHGLRPTFEGWPGETWLLRGYSDIDYSLRVSL